LTRTALATQPLVGSISNANFRRVADYIQLHTGIKMPKTKIHLIEGRLVRRVRDSEFATMSCRARPMKTPSPISSMR
jgi:hypothetical protein